MLYGSEIVSSSGYVSVSRAAVIGPTIKAFCEKCVSGPRLFQ
jgi:hypothetical protein